MRFTDDKFSSQFISTVGVDFKSKIIPDLEGSRVKLQLWDTAGELLRDARRQA
jgi:GTPase SAR1 family protein